MDKADEAEELMDDADAGVDPFEGYEVVEYASVEEVEVLLPEEPSFESIREVMTPESLTEELRSRNMLSEGEYVGTFRATGHSVVVVILPTGRKLTL
jgi:hypothetical protein